MFGKTISKFFCDSPSVLLAFHLFLGVLLTIVLKHWHVMRAVTRQG
jgi:hypothetical protein